MDRQDKELALELKELVESQHWETLGKLRGAIENGMKGNLFASPSGFDKSLEQHPNYAIIMAERHGEVLGVAKFFATIDMLLTMLKNEKGGKDGDK